MSELEALREIAAAAEELHLLEDFDEMPCQHECCAPLSWEAYQAARQRLADALRAVLAQGGEEGGR